MPWRFGYAGNLRTVLLVAAFTLLYTGLPLVIMGDNAGEFRGRMLCNLFIVTGVVGFFYKSLHASQRLTFYHKLALLLYGWCLFVTFISNSYIYHYGISNWLLQFAFMSPMLVIFLFDMLKLTWDDVLNGVVLAGVVIAAVILMDRISHIPTLDYYVRGSIFDAQGRKIVIGKLECATATCIVFMKLFQRRHFLINVVLFTGLFASAVIYSESRVVLFSLLSAFLIYILFFVKGWKKISALYVGAVFIVTAMTFILERQLERMLRFDLDNYIATDAGLRFRLHEMAYFRKLFEKTFGLGFGVMSYDPGHSNPLSWALHSGGYVYGTDDYGLALTDVGLYSTLYQFGYVGLLIVVFMSLYMVYKLLAVRPLPSSTLDHRILGAMLAMVLLNPIPYNLFTLEWSAFMGGILWFTTMKIDHRVAAAAKASAVLQPSLRS